MMKKIIEKINWSSVRNFLNKFLVVSGIVFSSLILIVAGFYTGYRYSDSTPKNIVIKGVSNMESGKTDSDFSVFWQAWDLLKSAHLDGENLNDKDLIYGAISGLVGATKDPHTVFLAPDDSKKFEEDIQGEFGGIGAELSVKDGFVVVVAPLEDTPASRIGIKAGDKILEINGEPVLNADVNEAVKKIRGEPGTDVTLTILSNGDEKTHEVTITRDIISIPTLNWEIKDNDIAYIELYSFNENAPFLFYKAALAIMLDKDIKGIVLDLRNNPGGYLEVAVNLAGWFLEDNTLVVSEQTKDGLGIGFNASGTGAFKDVPVVVLVNKGSASASEILAGALRDNRGVMLVGEKTFGKGTVQQMAGLKDGSQIKITIAKWVLPDGGTIDQTGLVPDIEVKISDTDAEAGIDTQLNRAIEEIKKML
jgi:carboxyl-terminal processing protease